MKDSPDDPQKLEQLRSVLAKAIRRRSSPPRLTKTKYRRAIVSFIDILGFSNFISTLSARQMAQLLNIFYRSGTEKSEYEDLSVHVFSDSIVRIRYLEERSHNSIFQHGPLYSEIGSLSTIQFELACWYGLFVRGGMTVGDVYSKKGMVFGPSIVEAYLLESQVALYPRIAVHPRIIHCLKNETVLWPFWPDLSRRSFVEDPSDADQAAGPGFKLDMALTEQMLCSKFMLGSDKVLFLDYMEANIKGATPSFVLDHKDHIEKSFDFANSKRVRQKYSWLAHYHNAAMIGSMNFAEIGINENNLHNYSITRKDILSMTRPKMKDAGYFSKINEFEILPKFGQ